MARLSLLLLLLVLISSPSSRANPSKSAFPLTSEKLQNGLYRSNLQSKYGPGSLTTYQCPGECTRRCSKTQYHKPCMFFCQKCCRKCLCVPPGFYGNKQVCSCYNNWKTKRGGPKCP
ncbi:gibberellin-regulated protein 6-like [Zingiber officinale]|uniref:gibberellin-regulated protein 6-like n=1 Tax=Zingiber officinale TaxID=94328 RepID=UPI001C4BF544|nr:gibberellin-regulated protein 6-like [Zingiber officinale]